MTHQALTTLKAQFYTEAQNVYPLIDTLTMSNMDAMDFIIIRATLCEQYASDQMHTWALTHDSDYAPLYAAMRRSAIEKVESLWPRLERKGHRWPAEWRAE